MDGPGVRTGLEAPLRPVLGKLAETLAKQRQIGTIGELLDFLPRTYLDPSRATDFTRLHEGEYVVLLAVVRHASTRRMKARRGTMLTVVVADEQGGELDLTFFRPYGHERALVPGRRVVCSGTVTHYGRRLQLTHPEYQVLGADSGAPTAYGEGPIPVYTAIKGTTSMKVSGAVDLALHAMGEVPDPIPAAVRLRHGLPSLEEAYRLVHQPSEESDHRRGRWRLKWQEADRRSMEASPTTSGSDCRSTSRRGRSRCSPR